MRSIAVKFVSMAFFAAIGLAVMVWMNRGPAPIKPEVPFGQLSPAEQQRRQGEVHDLQSQVAGLRASAQRHERRQFTLTVTNEELDTLLQNSLSSGRYPVRAVQCEIRTGQIVVQGTVKMHDLDTAVIIGGNVAPENGALAFKVTSLTIQGLPAPSEWKEKAQTTITEKLNQELMSSGVNVTGVQLAEGVMTIVGVTD